MCEGQRWLIATTARNYCKATEALAEGVAGRRPDDELVRACVAGGKDKPSFRVPRRPRLPGSRLARSGPLYAAYLLVLILGLHRREVLALTWGPHMRLRTEQTLTDATLLYERRCELR